MWGRMRIHHTSVCSCSFLEGLSLLALLYLWLNALYLIFSLWPRSRLYHCLYRWFWHGRHMGNRAVPGLFMLGHWKSLHHLFIALSVCTDWWWLLLRCWHPSVCHMDTDLRSKFWLIDFLLLTPSGKWWIFSADMFSPVFAWV